MDSNKRRKRFTFGLRHNIAANQRDEAVYKVQTYLQTYGYLNDQFTPELLDEPSQKALRLFQRRREIPETGAIDPDTVRELEAPRCGVPDFPLGRLASPTLDAIFSSNGSHRGRTELTYTLEHLDLVTTLRAERIKNAVASAFQTWRNEIRIRFREVQSGSSDFVLGWHKRSHSVGTTPCPLSFDGRGDDLGHAFAPRSPILAGQCHFDSEETWATGDFSTAIDLQTLALHEIGHLLGLSHSSDTDAVMFEEYRGRRIDLNIVDKRAIRRLYGIDFLDLELLVHFEGIEARSFRENEFTLPEDGSRSLKGFQLHLSEPVEGLHLRYMAQVGDSQSGFVEEGTFVGTRDPSQVGRIYGIAVELTGPKADDYNVLYMAKIQDAGATPLHTNGSFCGDRSLSKPIEAILVRVEKGHSIL